MEKELVAALFGGGSGNDSGNGGEDGGVLAPGDRAAVAGAAGGEDEGLMSAEEVLCKVLQGIARPLQVGTRRAAIAGVRILESGTGVGVVFCVTFGSWTLSRSLCSSVGHSRVLRSFDD